MSDRRQLAADVLVTFGPLAALATAGWYIALPWIEAL